METPKSSPTFAPVPFAVKLPDGSTERFIIKPLPITKLYQWLYLAKDQSEPAMVALACGKDIEWVDSLEIDQYALLAGKCHELLFPLAIRLAKGAPVAAALLAPVMQKAELGQRVITILSTGYGERSLKPQGSESAAATPSASPTPSPSTVSAPS